MYEKFYGFRESPFNLTPDSRFLFLGHHHREAMATLLYGISERKGFTLLTGEIGSGKTTLCRALVNELEETKTQIALILNSYLSEMELLQTVNQELAIDSSATTRKGLIDALNHYLLEQLEGGGNVALVIDEAQNLADSVLEQIRLLGNLETEQQKLLQIVLVGQPELQTALHGAKLEQLNQRIAVRYHLRPLESDEVEPYIHYRMRIAGLSVPLEFTSKAIDLLYGLTEGVPRKINSLCDRALLAGYVASAYEIDDAIIRTAAMEVGAAQWAEPTRARAEAPSQPAATRWISSTALLYALTLLVVVAFVPVLLSESGLWARWVGPPPAESVEPGGASDATTSPDTLVPEATPEPRSPLVLPAVLPAEQEEIAPVFRVAQPKPADPWTYDADQVVRVDRVEFCKAAAVVTLLATCGIEVNLQDFRELTVEDAQRLDLIEANRDLGLRSVEIEAGLAQALVYDVPAVVEIADPEERISSQVVLLDVTAKICRIADPMTGVQEVPRALFESFWRRAWVVYFDPDGFESLARGQRADAIGELQQSLSGLGLYDGELTGEFDGVTVEAVKNLQRKFNLFPTGQLDPTTVMLVTSHREVDRPRLTRQEEQGQ